MTPTKSYRIWFTQRSGSTVLCKGLEQTGIAGIPLELFNIDVGNSFSNTYKIATYTQLKTKLWKLGSTDNGVFGIKHDLHTARYNNLFTEILQLRNIKNQSSLNHDSIWSDIFPNCKHIFLTRRNKIRQAVSWWKAID